MHTLLLPSFFFTTTAGEAFGELDSDDSHPYHVTYILLQRFPHTIRDRVRLGHDGFIGHEVDVMQKKVRGFGNLGEKA